MKELENSIAELTREGRDELAAARDEANRLRQALDSSKARILNLRDALTAVAEEIGQSLGLPDVPQADHDDSFDELVPHPCDHNGAESAELVIDAGVASSDEAHTPGDFQPISGVTMMYTREHVEPEDAVLDQDSNDRCHNSNIDASAVRPISPQRNDSTGAQTVPLQPLLPQQVEYRAPDHLHWQTASGLNEGSRAFPTLLPADTPEEQLDLPNCTLSFPPGVINFPSVFSAHLGVIEFFAKKNSAYTQRLQVGGAEP